MLLYKSSVVPLKLRARAPPARERPFKRRREGGKVHSGWPPLTEINRLLALGALGSHGGVLAARLRLPCLCAVGAVLGLSASSAARSVGASVTRARSLAFTRSRSAAACPTSRARREHPSTRPHDPASPSPRCLAACLDHVVRVMDTSRLARETREELN